MIAGGYIGRLRSVVGKRLLLVPGARIILQREGGDILLQNRSDFGVWGLPGGSAEEGECLTQTIIRELLEETGLTISDPQPFGFGCDPSHETITFPNGDKCQFFVLMFYAHHFRG